MKDKIIEIGRDSIWYLVATALASLIAFVSIPIFTRVFDPHDYGIYSLAATTIALASPMFYLWMSSSVIRFYPEHKKNEELNIFYSTVFHYVPHFLLFFMAVLVPIAAFVLPLGKYRTLVCLGIMIFALFSVFQILQSLLRAIQMSWQYATAMIAVSACRYFVGVGLAVWGNAGVDGIFWAWMGALIIAVPVEFFIVSAHRYVKRSDYSARLMKIFLGYGLVLVLGSALQQIMVSIDRYMVQFFKGASQVGLYSFVYNIIEGTGGVLGGFLMLAAGPVVMKTYEYHGEEDTIALISRLSRYFFIILVPSMVGFWVLRGRLLTVIAAPEYRSATGVVLPLAAGDLLVKLAWLPSLAFLVKKKTKLLLVPAAAGALINVGLNAVLIPRMGYVGAAWTTFVSYALYLLIIAVLGWKYMPWRFSYPDLLRVCLASCVMGGSLVLLNEIPVSGVGGLLIVIVSGIVIYGAAIVLFRGIKKTEVGFIVGKARQFAGRLMKH